MEQMVLSASLVVYWRKGGVKNMGSVMVSQEAVVTKVTKVVTVDIPEVAMEAYLQ